MKGDPRVEAMLMHGREWKKEQDPTGMETKEGKIVINNFRMAYLGKIRWNPRNLGWK